MRTLLVYAVFLCNHATGCEAYSFMTDGYRIFNVHTHLGACLTHKLRSGTNKYAQELTRSTRRFCTNWNKCMCIVWKLKPKQVHVHCMETKTKSTCSFCINWNHKYMQVMYKLKPNANHVTFYLKAISDLNSHEHMQWMLGMFGPWEWPTQHQWLW